MAISNSKDVSLAKTVISACGKSELRADGYQNVLTKYGTKQDNSTAFSFVPENFTDDYTLSMNYQFNGLFAKIIDLPTGEAVSKGFKLNIVDNDIEAAILDKFEDLNGEEAFETALKWSRLYGGGIIVPLVNDGRGLNEPLNFRTIRGIDELKVFEAAIVNPIYQSTYYAGEPEYYQVNSIDGIFTVHSSRCLVFKNGKLPEFSIDTKRRAFGYAEYDRIKTALRETVTTHGYAPRLLERSVQSIIKIKDLADLMQTDEGENTVVKRLQVIDLARSMFNSIAVDAEGEDYDFKIASYSGVKEIIDSTCNMLSAVTDIPQTLLFGRAPEGMNSTGESDSENYYNMVRRIQSRIMKAPLKKLISIIIQSLVRTGRLEEAPTFKLEFNPLWSMSEQEKASVEQTKAQTKLIKAQTAQTYVGMQSLDPSEIRAGLAKEEEYDVETLLDDVPDDELFASIIDESSDEAPSMGNSPTETLPQQPLTEEIPEQQDSLDEPTAAAVLVMSNKGEILCGIRSDNKLVCGPGGHIEHGEAPIQAAIREAREEFNIIPTSLIPLGTIGENTENQHKTSIFLCNAFEGVPKCDEKEMHAAMFMPLNVLLELFSDKLFAPFKESLAIYQKTAQIGQLPEVENSVESGIINNTEQNSDEEPHDWITVNGHHIPVDENNNPIGGQKKAIGEKPAGATTGARNPHGEAAEKHAKQYYESVRKMQTDVQNIAKSTEFSEEDISKVKDYVFNNTHDLGELGISRFEPDYMMAESWRRLIEGKPEPHDITLIKHELLELSLVEQGYSQDKAHIISSQKYNYDKEATAFHGKVKKYKKE